MMHSLVWRDKEISLLEITSASQAWSIDTHEDNDVRNCYKKIHIFTQNLIKDTNLAIYMLHKAL